MRFNKIKIYEEILKIYEKNVNIFIAPSQFMKDTVVRFGQNEKNIEVIYNPHNLDNLGSKEITNKIENYFFSFGRLSEEKGLRNLIEAASKTGQKILIAGIGPEEEKLKFHFF